MKFVVALFSVICLSLSGLVSVACADTPVPVAGVLDRMSPDTKTQTNAESEKGRRSGDVPLCHHEEGRSSSKAGTSAGSSLIGKIAAHGQCHPCCALFVSPLDVSFSIDRPVIRERGIDGAKALAGDFMGRLLRPPNALAV